MKTVLFSLLFLTALSVSAQEVASVKITCLIKTKIGEDGADRPRMKLLATDTQELSADGVASLSGQDPDGTVSFKVDIRAGNVYIYMTDRLSNRESAFSLRGVDVRSPLFRVIGGLGADSRVTKSRELVLNCLPAKEERGRQ